MKIPTKNIAFFFGGILLIYDVVKPIFDLDITLIFLLILALLTIPFLPKLGIDLDYQTQKAGRYACAIALIFCVGVQLAYNYMLPAVIGNNSFLGASLPVVGSAQKTVTEKIQAFDEVLLTYVSSITGIKHDVVILKNQGAEIAKNLSIISEQNQLISENNKKAEAQNAIIAKNIIDINETGRKLKQQNEEIAENLSKLQETNNKLENATRKVKQETSKDPRKELANIGVSWDRRNFRASFNDDDLRVFELFVAGGYEMDHYMVLDVLFNEDKNAKFWSFLNELQDRERYCRIDFLSYPKNEYWQLVSFSTGIDVGSIRDLNESFYKLTSSHTLESRYIEFCKGYDPIKELERVIQLDEKRIEMDYELARTMYSLCDVEAKGYWFYEPPDEFIENYDKFKSLSNKECTDRDGEMLKEFRSNFISTAFVDHNGVILKIREVVSKLGKNNGG